MSVARNLAVTTDSPRPLSFESDLEASIVVLPGPAERATATRGELSQFLRERQLTESFKVDLGNNGALEGSGREREASAGSGAIVGAVGATDKKMDEAREKFEPTPMSVEPQSVGMKKSASQSKFLGLFQRGSSSSSSNQDVRGSSASLNAKPTHQRSPSAFGLSTSILPRSPAKREQVTTNRLTSTADSPARITIDNLYSKPGSTVPEVRIQERSRSRLSFSQKQSLPNLFASFQSSNPSSTTTSKSSTSLPPLSSAPATVTLPKEPHSRRPSATSLWIRRESQTVTPSSSTPALANYGVSSPSSSLSLDSSSSAPRSDARKSSNTNVSLHARDRSSSSEVSLGSVTPSSLQAPSPAFTSRRKPSVPESALKAIMSLGRRSRGDSASQDVTDEELASWRRPSLTPGSRILETDMEVLDQESEDLSDWEERSETLSIPDDVLVIERTPTRPVFDQEPPSKIPTGPEVETEDEDFAPAKPFQFPQSTSTPALFDPLYSPTTSANDDEQLASAAAAANRFLSFSESEVSLTSPPSSISSMASSNSAPQLTTPKPLPFPASPNSRFPIRRPTTTVPTPSKDFHPVPPPISLGGLDPPPRHRKVPSRTSLRGSPSTATEVETPRARRIVTDEAWHHLSLSSSTAEANVWKNTTGRKRDEQLVVERSSSKRRSTEVDVAWDNLIDGAGIPDLAELGQVDQRHKKLNLSLSS